MTCSQAAVVEWIGDTSHQKETSGTTDLDDEQDMARQEHQKHTCQLRTAHRPAIALKS